MAGQTVTVSVLADTKNFSRAFQNLGKETGLSRFGGIVKNVGTAIATAAGVGSVGLVGLGTKAVSLASDLEQSIGGVDAVFKQNADQIHKWAKTSSTELGLSTTEYNQFATVIGAQFKNLGVPMDEIAGKTNDMITLGADLSATFGGDTKTAVDALSGAFKGEYDALEKYGISLKESEVSALLAARGQSELTGEAEKAARQQAITDLIMQQSADSQGMFAKESDTLAGKQQRLGAQLKDLGAKIGTFLLPAISAVVGWLSDNLQPAFEKFSGWMKETGVPALKTFYEWFNDNILPVLKQLGDYIVNTVVPALVDMGKWIVDNKDWLSAIAVAIGTVVVAVKTYLAIMRTWKALTTAIKAAQIALNIAMAANPIGLIITLVAALVAGLVYFFTQTETGKELWEKIWTAIKDAVQAVATWFTETLLPALQSVWDTIVLAWETLKVAAEETWNTIKTGIETAWNAIKEFFTTTIENIKTVFQGIWDFLVEVWSWTPIGFITTHWQEILDFFGAIPEKIKEFFNTAKDWLQEKGVQILLGLYNGVTQKWADVKTWFNDRKQAVLDFFTTAKDWLLQKGKDIIQGIFDGVKSTWTWLSVWFSNMYFNVTGFFHGAITWLWNAGYNIVKGLLDGLLNKWEDVKRTVSGWGQWIRDHKGPKSYDLALLVPAGQWIVQGLINGLHSQMPKLRNELSDIADEIQNTDLGVLHAGLDADGIRSAAASSSSVRPGAVYNVTVQAISPNAEVGRAVKTALQEYDRMNGGR